MQKKFIPLIVAAVLGVLAIVLTNSYIQQQTQEAKQELIASQKNQATIVVARQDIPSGTTLTETMLKEARVNKAIAQPRVASSIDRVVGKITVAPISKDEQVLLNKVSISAQETSLSSKIPRGKRAITVPVDNISSVGGMIRSGDHVDIVGVVPIPGIGADGKQVNQMATLPLFQDVMVLAMGQEFGAVSGEKVTKTASSIVTLALAPQEANLVAFVQEQGKIRLVLRSPEDTQTQQAVPASWDTLFRTVMPQAFVKQEVVEEKPQKKVEIYRGLKKDIKVIE